MALSTPLADYGGNSFAVLDGRLMHARYDFVWKQGRNDFIDLCGVKYSLVRGATLQQVEQRWYARNRDAINAEISRKREVEADKLAKRLQTECQDLADKLFFVTNLCYQNHNNENPEKDDVAFMKEVVERSKEYKAPTLPSQEVLPPSILSDLLKDDCVAINGRFYPILPADSPVFLFLNNRKYRIDGSRLSIPQAERAFLSEIEKRTSQLAYNTTGDIVSMQQMKTELEAKIEEEIQRNGVKKVGKYLECGRIGYGPVSGAGNCIYWLVIAHTNNSMGGNYYPYGNSAMAASFAGRRFTGTWCFATRYDQNNDFSNVYSNFCIGVHLDISSVQNAMKSLIAASGTISETGAMHA